MPLSAIAPTHILVGCVAVEIILAILLTSVWVQRGWPEARTIYVAALPLPALIIAFCLYVFVDAATASKESCGVDACGMAMGAAVILASTAMVLYVFGLVVAKVTMHFSQSAKPDDFQ